MSHFSVTPSTTEASAHPDLGVSVRFAAPAEGLKDVALHLPAGLTANPRAAPYCRRKRLLADLCPAASKLGAITLVGVAFGFELRVTRKIYNVRPGRAERLRLAVPLFGSLRRPGLAAELPVTERPADGGLDMAVVGFPREVSGITVRIREIGFSFKGIVRSKVRKKSGKRSFVKTPFLTNPSTCAPATSLLVLKPHDAPAVESSSAFTPTGCPS